MKKLFEQSPNDGIDRTLENPNPSGATTPPDGFGFNPTLIEIERKQQEATKKRQEEIRKVFTEPDSASPEIFNLFTDFDSIKKQLESGVNTDDPSSFKQKHLRNVKAVTGSFIANELLRGTDGPFAQSLLKLLPDKLAGVNYGKAELQALIQKGYRAGGKVISGEALYDLLFRKSSGYMNRADELATMSTNTQSFGAERRGQTERYLNPESETAGPYTRELAQYEFDKIQNKSNLTPQEKIFYASQPFPVTSREEGKGPDNYYKPVNLKDRMPEGFDFMDEYNQFFGGAPSAPKATPSYQSDDIETKRTQPGYGTNKNAPTKPTT